MGGLDRRGARHPARTRRRRHRRSPFASAVFLAAVLCIAAGGFDRTPGAKASGVFSVQVTAQPPNGAVPLRVAFNASPSTGTPTYVAWEFGDGTYLNGSNRSYIAPVHAYAVAGSFTVNVTVWEGSAYATSSLGVDVYVGPFVASVTPTPLTGPAPLTVIFTASASGGTGTYLGYDWMFGDGGTGIGPTVANTYRAPGTYTVTVQVGDSGNALAVGTATVVVTGNGSDAAPPFPPLEIAGVIVGVGALLVLAYVAVRRHADRAVEERSGSDAPPPEDDAPPEFPEPIGSVDQGMGGADPGAPADGPPDPEVLPLPEPLAGTLLDGAAEGNDPGVGALKETGGVQEGRRISHAIILRLASLGHLGPEDTPDSRWTQQGLGEHLGAAQNRVSNVLRRLLAVGVVAVETRHVVGRGRRVKVYSLTPRGEALARAYRRDVGPSGPRGR